MTKEAEAAKAREDAKNKELTEYRRQSTETEKLMAQAEAERAAMTAEVAKLKEERAQLLASKSTAA